MKKIPSEITAAIKELPTVITDGWCTEQKATDLVQLILDTKPEVVVEIGAYSGRSLIPMALALKENECGKIYGIDPWENADSIALETVEDHAIWWAKLDLNRILDICTKGIHEFGVARQAVLIRAMSQDAVGLFNKIDLLHVDGCHSETASCMDVDLYLPKLKPGGHIVLDDTDWESLQPALEKVEEYCDLVKDGKTYRIYKKRGRSS